MYQLTANRLGQGARFGLRQNGSAETISLLDRNGRRETVSAREDDVVVAARLIADRLAGRRLSIAGQAER